MAVILIKIERDLVERFPGLSAHVLRIRDVTVKREHPDMERFRAEAVEGVRRRWTLDQLREYPIFRAYRDFFWRVGVDPTKTRPAAEALIRRILHGNLLPRINTLVDAYNIASIDTAVALAAFDEETIEGEPLMRTAKAAEEFLGIGMDKPVRLGGGEVVVSDERKLIAIYPYRDAEVTKVDERTRSVWMLVCGVPNIDAEALAEAGRVAQDYVIRFNDGSAS